MVYYRCLEKPTHSRLSELTNIGGQKGLVDKKYSYIMECKIVQRSLCYSSAKKSVRSRIRKVLGLGQTFKCGSIREILKEEGLIEKSMSKCKEV